MASIYAPLMKKVARAWFASSHHGSRYSTKESLLARFHPADAFISAGRHNRYGHPDPEVLDRLEKEGSRILVTADNGAIILETDGKRTGAAYYRDLLK